MTNRLYKKLTSFIADPHAIQCEALNATDAGIIIAALVQYE